MDEARARRAPLVAAALGRNMYSVNSEERTEIRLQQWRTRYPEVTIEVMGASLTDFLADHHDDLRKRYSSCGSDDVDFLGPAPGTDLERRRSRRPQHRRAA